MTKLDEKQIIKIFQSGFGNKKFVSEDVETFQIGKNFGVIKTDTLVASTDVPPKMSLVDVARKSVVASISDFAAKGVRPLYCIISVSMPKNFSKSKVEQLARGFKIASDEFGFRILGGDTNQAKELVISVTLVGMAGKITPRNGSHVGDVIMVTGPFGLYLNRGCPTCSNFFGIQVGLDVTFDDSDFDFIFKLVYRPCQNRCLA